MFCFFYEVVVLFVGVSDQSVFFIFKCFLIVCFKTDFVFCCIKNVKKYKKLQNDKKLLFKTKK